MLRCCQDGHTAAVMASVKSASLGRATDPSLYFKFIKVTTRTRTWSYEYDGIVRY
jgi:hypothetical protein